MGIEISTLGIQIKNIDGRGGKRGPYKKRHDTIKAFVRIIYMQSPTLLDEEVIRRVQVEFPGCAFDKSHVGVYKVWFREEGLDIPYGYMVHRATRRGMKFKRKTITIKWLVPKKEIRRQRQANKTLKALLS